MATTNGEMSVGRPCVSLVKSAELFGEGVSLNFRPPLSPDLSDTPDVCREALSLEPSRCFLCHATVCRGLVPQMDTL